MDSTAALMPNGSPSDLYVSLIGLEATLRLTVLAIKSELLLLLVFEKSAPWCFRLVRELSGLLWTSRAPDLALLLLLLFIGTNAGDEDELVEDKEDGDGALLDDPGELEPLTLRFDPPKNAGSLKLASRRTFLEGLAALDPLLLLLLPLLWLLLLLLLT